MKQYWIDTHENDQDAIDIFERHYSCRHSGVNQRRNKGFVGPGEKIVLISPNKDALFSWVKCIRADGQEGVNCNVFRNESRELSSRLILEAEAFAWRRWPGERLFTFVNHRKIRSTNPGFCFIKAGWKRCGISGKYLWVLEKFPE